MRTKLLLILMLWTNAACAGAESQVFTYSAFYLPYGEVDEHPATDDRGPKVSISFDGSWIVRSSSDRRSVFDGCSRDGAILDLRTSLSWMNFRIDLDNSTTAEGQPLRFNYAAKFLGEEVRVIGVNQGVVNFQRGYFTILYYSEKKGIVGFGLMGNRGSDKIEPIFWLEDSAGICQRLEESEIIGVEPRFPAPHAGLVRGQR